jgi:hypothetical protein
MARWEYMVVEEQEGTDFAQSLNFLGEQGWEAVGYSVTYQPDIAQTKQRALLKRPK